METFNAAAKGTQHIIWKIVYKNIRPCSDKINKTPQQNTYAYL